MTKISDVLEEIIAMFFPSKRMQRLDELVPNYWTNKINTYDQNNP